MKLVTLKKGTKKINLPENQVKFMVKKGWEIQTSANDKSTTVGATKK